MKKLRGARLVWGDAPTALPTELDELRARLLSAGYRAAEERVGDTWLVAVTFADGRLAGGAPAQACPPVSDRSLIEAFRRACSALGV